MKLLQLQTAAPELNLLNNHIYQELIAKFNKVFARNEVAKKLVEKTTMINEGSQFYNKQVRLAGTGLRTKATVLYARETGLMINEDPVMSLTLRFYTTKTVMKEITAKTVVSKIAIPQPADIITIAYDTEDLSMIAVL